MAELNSKSSAHDQESQGNRIVDGNHTRLGIQWRWGYRSSKQNPTAPR